LLDHLKARGLKGSATRVRKKGGAPGYHGYIFLQSLLFRRSGSVPVWRLVSRGPGSSWLAPVIRSRSKISAPILPRRDQASGQAALDEQLRWQRSPIILFRTPALGLEAHHTR